MLDFDDVNLSDELSQLDHWQRVAFVASCVEVLIPSYVRFAELEEIGDPGMVASVIDRVWVSLGDPQGDLGRLELPSSEALLELSPEEEDWNEWAPQAENAIAALSFLVDLTRNDDPGLAVRAAQQCYEAADEFAAREIDAGLLDAAARAELIGSVVVQNELRRQKEVVETLRQASDRGPSVLTTVREAARLNAIGGA